MKRLVVILIIFALIAVSLMSINQPVSKILESKTPFAEPPNTFPVDPFYVHESTNTSNYTFSLSNGTYFIEIASVDPFSVYYNATLSSDGGTMISLYTENFVFHGIIVNHTNVFTLTTSGKGRWLFSESAQDPNTVYSFTFNDTDAYVLVPQIGTYSAVNISMSSPSRFYYEIYDSLLKPMTSYVSSKQLSSKILNLSGRYVGIIFIVVNGTSSLQISWSPYSAPGNSSNGGFSTPSTLAVVGIPIIGVIVLVSIMFKIMRKARKGISRRR